MNIGILSFLLSERPVLCNDSLYNILTQDSESGWVTLKNKEGENYRVNMAEKFHDKFYGKDYWNGQIYTYKNSDRAVFLNGNKTVLTDDEYTYLKV